MATPAAEEMARAEVALGAVQEEEPDGALLQREEYVDSDGEDRSGLGPEPDVVIASGLFPVAATDEDLLLTKEAKDEAWALRLRPSPRRACVSLIGATLALTLFLIVYYAMAPNPALTGDDPDTTELKKASSVMMMNRSAAVCSAAYDYSCGTYNARYTTSSLFSETQLLVAHKVKAQEPDILPWVAAEIEGLPIVANATVMAALGMHGCVDIDIDPDYTEKDVVGLYLSAPCIEACPVIRHPHEPVQVSQADLDRLPAPIQAITSVAVGAGVRVWWLPPNETVLGLGRWLDLHCGEVTPESQWNRTVEGLSPWGAALDYYRMTTHLSGPNIDALITVVRKMLADYFLSEAPFLTSDTLRGVFAQRVMSIPVHYGHGTNSIDPLCSVGTPLLRCMTDRWEARMEAVRTRATVNSTWCMSGLEVNAYYSPLSDAVYIPYGIAQWPFYDSGWPLWMQMATLGGVIAHEIGHSVRPGWSFPVELGRSGEVAVDQFEECLIRSFAGSGSTRTELTLSENWADAISVRGVLRYLRRISTSTTADGLVLWMQTWCNAGHPKYLPLSTDPHATPFLRVNGTMKTLLAFYTAFDCVADLPTVC